MAQPDLELVREEYLKAIEGHLSEARRLARQLNMSDGELAAMLSLLKEEEP